MRRIAAFVTGLLFTCASIAQDAPSRDSQFYDAMAKSQQAIDQASKDDLVADPLKGVSPEMIEEAKRYADQAARIQRGALAKYGAENSGIPESEIEAQEIAGGGSVTDANKIFIFVSSSMPRAALRDLVVSTAQRKDVAILIRGLVPGTTSLPQTFAWMREMVKGLKEFSSIYIQPQPFENLRVESVPLMVKVDDKLDIAGIVYGSTNVELLEKKVAQRSDTSKPADLGTIGPTYKVAERDLIDEMKERMAKVNWKERMQKAYERFWTKQTFVDLARAQHDRIRYVDPSVVVPNDIPAPGKPGQYIAREGDIVNPLKAVPMTRRVYIFDGTDPKQLAAVKAYAKAHRDSKSSIYITTRVQQQDGWKHFQDLLDTFNAPLYVLPPEMSRMFRLESVPAIVTGEGARLRIEELGIPS